MTVMTSRQFDSDADGALRATESGPVFITGRGGPAYVLLSMEEYMKLKGSPKSVAEAFYTPGADEIEFEPPRFEDTELKPVDLADVSS